ncbi:hypothetical protein, partial [Thermocrinis sp.]|uniref:hypothetical protein n=1 Tax=Thermocrinis sp. TaxID=2024383 RepID=UPI0026291C0A
PLCLPKALFYPPVFHAFKMLKPFLFVFKKLREKKHPTRWAWNEVLEDEMDRRRSSHHPTRWAWNWNNWITNNKGKIRHHPTRWAWNLKSPH